MIGRDRDALLSARRLARADADEWLQRLRKMHLDMVSDGACFPAAALEAAWGRMALWERRKLCAPWYLERWRRILEAGPSSLVEALNGPDAAALLGNTPFFFPPDDQVGKVEP
jgi:hypothetical protein